MQTRAGGAFLLDGVFQRDVENLKSALRVRVAMLGELGLGGPDGGRLPEDAHIPSERTISNIARDMRPEDVGQWRMRDADSATVGLVLRTLHEVCHRTEGRVTSLTRAEAQVIPAISAALDPRSSKLGAADSAWQTYTWTRFYLSWVRSDQDEEDVALLFASMHTGGGETPITAVDRIDRAYNAAIEWLSDRDDPALRTMKGAKS